MSRPSTLGSRMFRALSPVSPTRRQTVLTVLVLAVAGLAGVVGLGLNPFSAAEPPGAPAAEASPPLHPSLGYVIVPLPDGSLAAYAKFVDPARGFGFRAVELPAPGGDMSPPRLTGQEMWLPPTAVHHFSETLRQAGSKPVLAAERWGVDLENGRVQMYAFRDVSWTALTLLGVLVALLVSLAAGLSVTTRRLREERQERAAIALAHQWKEAAREAERARLAREIHDGPLQGLHALRLLAALPAGGDGAPPESGLGEAANGVASELRAIAEGLRPPALSRFGLAAALEGHARRLRQRSEVSVSVEAFDDADRLTEEARTALFRIGQEGISNAIQHGHARTVHVRAWPEPAADAPDRLCLTVADDGVGLGALDVEALVADGHFGVAGMHERAALLGASFSLAPRPEGGTVLTLIAPWVNVSRDLSSIPRPSSPLPSPWRPTTAQP